MKLYSFFSELKRRNVYKVGVAYLIASWLILQAASILLPTFEAPLWIMKVVTLFLIAGLPVALIIAWAFELTPEVLKKTDEVSPAKSITKDTGSKLNRIIIGALSVVIVILLVDRFVGVTDRGQENIETKLNSIAVYPFEIRGKEDLHYLREGMVDLISTKLDGIPGMNSIDPYVILAKV